MYKHTCQDVIYDPDHISLNSIFRSTSFRTYSTYLTVTVVSIFAHEIDTVAVFIPEGASVGQGTVCDSDVVVVVIGGERSALVIGQRVTWRRKQW